MKKRIILQLRGIEGTGNTRLGLNLLEMYKNEKLDAYLIANSTRKWPREKVQDITTINKIKFVDDNYFDELLKITNLSETDEITVDIISVPAKVTTKNETERIKQEKAVENSLSTITKLKNNFGAKINYIQCDHSIMSISRNIYRSRPEFWDDIDKIISFSHNNDFNKRYIQRFPEIFDKFKDNKNIEVYLTPYKFDFKDILPYEDKIKNTFHFIGRSALWKGPVVWRNEFDKTFKSKGYASVIEGYEMSISGKTYLSLDNDIKKGWDSRGEFHKKSLNESSVDYYEFGKVSQIYPQYTQHDAFKRIQKAMFGIFFSYLKASGNGPIEYTLFEMINNGTVPIILKELYDFATLPNGEKMNQYSPDEMGVIVYDLNKSDEMFTLIDKIQNDKLKYDQLRNNAQSFWKQNIDEYMNIFKVKLEI